MSKLLTDLMAAERKRRQFAPAREAVDVPAAVRLAAMPSAFRNAPSVRREEVPLALPPAEPGAAASLPHGPGWHRLGVIGLVLVVGVGIGFWLGKPSVATPSSPGDTGEWRLRLDDRLRNPPQQESGSIRRI